MVWTGRRTSALVGMAFVSIVAGMSLLGYYSLRVSRTAGQATQQSLRASTTALAEKIVRKVEKRIIDQDRALFDLVDLKDLNDFKVFWGRLTTMSSLVEGAMVLDHKFEVLHYASKEGPLERRQFTSLFNQNILPALELAKLAPGHHKHLHSRIAGRDYLISYMFMRQRGGRFLVALKINMAYVLHRMLTEELRPLSARYITAVSDQDGRVVYGARPPQEQLGDRVIWRFPTTLYRWRVELTPRAAASLAAHAEQRERISAWLFVASLVATLLGLAMLIWLVRRERVVAALKSDFVSTVTHELKTPLSLIRMYAELMTLDRPGAAERRPEYAAILTRETDRLSRLIDNVLDLSRLERGLGATTPQRGDLGQLVREAVSVQQDGPNADRAEIEVSLPEQPAHAEVDAEAVRLALLNLLDNAVKYGAKRVEVSIAAQGDRWAITVADDGPGIPPEERERLFERFFRGRQALGSRERGSGIGLSLVQLVAEAHGGSVSVADRERGGTAFCVTLSRAEDVAGPVADPPERTGAGRRGQD
ncbi:MAG: HAMP domain-containing sensor histidine kinase [bacterium]